MIKSLSSFLLSIFGWKVESTELLSHKYVVIGAPHTSNWDFPIALLTLSSIGLRFSWAAKNTLFFFPLGHIFRLMGGVPVNRKIRNAFLSTMLDQFTTQEHFIIAIAPEGTRSFNDHWKCGFYQLACDAQVDIALAFVDYAEKKSGIGMTFTPSGNPKDDFEIIKSFYANIQGKHPEKTATIAIRPKELNFLIKQQQRKTQNKKN